MTVQTCAKTPYLTHRHAKQAARRIKAAGGNRMPGTRSAIMQPYKCPHCGQYHLTGNSLSLRR